MRIGKWSLQLATGTLIAQVLSIVALPVLSRLYSEQEFGKFTLLTSTSATLLPLATLRLENIFQSERGIKESQQILSVYLKVIFIFCMTLTVLEWIYWISSRATNLPKFSCFWLLLPLQIFSLALVTIFNQILFKTKLFATSAKAGILQNGISGMSQSILGVINPNVVFLSLGAAVGKLACFLPYRNSLKREFNFEFAGSRRLKTFLKKNIATTGILVSASFLDAALISVPAILLNSYFGSKFAGYFGMTQLILYFPMTLIGGAVGSVLFSEIATPENSFAQDFKSLRREIRQILFLLTLSASGYAIIVMLFSERLFPLILGSKWTTAGHLASMLAVPYAVGFIWYPLANIFLALKLWKTTLLIAIARLSGSLICGFLALVLHWDWEGFLLAFAIGSAIPQLFGLAKIIHLIVRPSSIQIHRIPRS